MNWIQRLLARLGTPAGASVSADIATVNGVVDDIETKVGTNVDAAGTTTLFARLRQIVDTYLADATIGLAALEALVDDLETRLGTPAAGTVAGDVESIETKVGTNVDAAGTTTLFARLKQIVDTYLADGTIGLAALEALVDDLETAVGAIEGATTLHNKLTAARAGYLDNINNADLANVIRQVAETTGTFVYDETGAGVQEMVALAITARAKIGGIWLDLSNVTQDTTIRLEHKIDGSTFRIISAHPWVTTDDDGVLIAGFTAYRDIRVTLQCGGGGAGNVNVPYAIV